MMPIGAFRADNSAHAFTSMEAIEYMSAGVEVHCFSPEHAYRHAVAVCEILLVTRKFAAATAAMLPAARVGYVA